MVDAHTHLHDRRIAGTFPELLDEAHAAGVTGMSLCGTSPDDWEDVSARCTAWKGLLPAFGVHPWFADSLPPDWLDRLEQALRDHPDAALGEVGLDAVRQGPDPASQRRVFAEQLELAVRMGRPVILHAVRCVPEVLEEIESCGKGSPPRFMFHGFPGPPGLIRRIERMGGFLSFGGMLLNPKARRTQAAAAEVSDHRMLAETDSPDGPIPHPALLPKVLQALATQRKQELSEVARRTHANALEFFGNSATHRGALFPGSLSES